MKNYQIITLVDVTRTGVNRDHPDHLVRSQQANFNSLLQATSLRSNIDWTVDPEPKQGILPIAGSKIKGRYWIWNFATERSDVFDDQGDPVALLTHDLNGVPVIEGLTETTLLLPSAFFTQGNNTNTWVTAVN